jgi:hypothetical protein
MQHNNVERVPFALRAAHCSRKDSWIGNELAVALLWWEEEATPGRPALCLLDRKWLPFLRSAEAVRTQNSRRESWIHLRIGHARMHPGSKTMPCMREKNVCRVRTV